MKIWIIEDNPPTRLLMKSLVQTAATDGAHECREFATAEEALGVVTNDPASAPDLYLVDLNLPGMGGMEFCRAIREKQQSVSEYIPYMVICTAEEGGDVLSKVLGAGANDYLPKPVNAKVLQTRLRVAERLIEQAKFSSEQEYARVLVSYVLNNTTLATGVATIDSEGDPLSLVYANSAMMDVLDSSTGMALGQSLPVLQKWKQDFTTKVLTQISAGQTVQTRIFTDSQRVEAMDLRLSIHPVHTADERSIYYLITIEKPA